MMRAAWPTGALLLSALLLISACEKKAEIMTEAEAQQWVNKELLEDAKVIYSDSGRLKIKIDGPKLVRHIETGNTREEFIEGFFAQFYDDDERLVNTLASKYALRKRSAGNTLMRDSVVFASLNQEVLKTSELIWDERNGKLHTDKFVRLIRKDEIIQGFGFETDQSFKKGSLRSVDGQIPSEKLLGSEKE